MQKVDLEVIYRQNLDYKYLAEDLIENEPELFAE